MTPVLNASTPEFVRVEPDDSASNIERWDPLIPFSMPVEQTYYWSAMWQAEEAGAVADLAAGRFVDFTGDDPYDVVRWLQEPDE